jgi:hypothetical protein
MKRYLRFYRRYRYAMWAVYWVSIIAYWLSTIARASGHGSW